MENAVGIRSVVMRGGTSRGLILDAAVLPSEPQARQDVVAALYGSGSSGQIDGLGGGVAHTSKVAVVGPSEDPSADVDYLFGQVATDRAAVDFSGTCGNMASAVALYAVEEGLTAGSPDPRSVRIRDVSSGQIITCEVLPDGAESHAGGGLPGTGSPVVLDLAGMQGSSAGSVLPTGKAVQELSLPDGGTIPCTIVDVGNVLAFVPAAALGLSGEEAPEVIEASPAMAVLGHLRGAVAVALGWCGTPEDWASSPSRLPFIALLGEPSPGTGAEGADLTVRLFAVGRIHRSIAVTAVAACGAGAAIEGSVVQGVLARPFAEILAAAEPGQDAPVRVAHPGGLATIGVRVDASGPTGGSTAASSLRYMRTARRLMEGTAYLPAGLLAAR